MSEAFKNKQFLVGAALFIAGAAIAIGSAGTASPWAVRLMYSGALMMLGGVLAESLPDALAELQTAHLSGRDVIAPWRIIYGTSRIGGVITYMHLSGSTSRFLNLVVTLAGHQVESIDDLYLNDANVNLSGGNGTGSWSGLVRVETRIGTRNQTVYTSLRDITLPEWLPPGGLFGGMRFNGRGQYADVPTTTALNPASTTIEFMVRSRAISAASVILALGANSAWKIEWLGGSNRIRFTDSAGTSVTTVSSGISNDVWYQISITAGPGGLEIWRDAVSKDTNGTAYAPGTGSKIMTWGSIDGTQEYWGGDLDNVRIWNVIRTPTQIFENAQRQVGPQANLIANWNVNDGSGVTITDNAGSSHNATIYPLWTNNHLQSGRANAYIRLKWNSEKFTDGVPEIHFDLKGIKLLDPRTAQDVISVTPATDVIEVTSHGLITDDQIQFTTDDVLPVPLLPDTSYWIRDETTDTFKVALDPGDVAINITTSGVGNHTIVSRLFSSNSALCIVDYLMDAQFGFGVPYERIDITTLAAAANICDESVTLDAGGSELRYTCNGVLFGDATPQRNIELLLATMGGQLVYAGGRWYVYAAAWRAPTVTFDEDDVTSTMNISTLVSRQSSFNAVKGLYQDLENNGDARDYPAILDAGFEAADGKRVFKEMGLPLTNSPTMAQRLAKIFLQRSRQAISVRLSMKLSIFQFQPPNTIRLTNARMGWSAKAFEIIDGSLSTQPDNEGVPSLVYALELRETASTVYDWLSSEEGDIDPLPQTGLPDPFDIRPPNNLVVESGTAQLFLRLDGTVFSRARVSWDAHDNDEVIDGGQIQVQFKKAADSIWLSFGFISGAETEVFVLNVEDGVAYDFRVRAVSSGGVPSGFVQVLTHTIIGKTTRPEDVTGFSALQNGTIIIFQWNQVADIDLSGYEIRQGYLGDTWEDSTQLTQTLKGTRITDAAVSPSPFPFGSATRQPWQFYIKAIDTTKNESFNATGFQLTVTPPLDINLEIEQSPVWRGIKTNYTRNPIFGTLNPTDQDLATGDDQDVFDNFIVNPFASSGYEAPILDTGFDDRTRAWMSIQGSIGPGEVGILKPTFELDHRTDAESFDGFEVWSIGDVIARHFKAKFNQEASNGLFTILEFTPTMDVIEHSETVVIVVPVGGLEITFQQAFFAKPEVVVTPPASLFAVFDAITTIGFTCFFLNASGVDVGGTGSYTAIGA